MYLIAAGTGITPMLGLVKFMLARSNPRCERVHLLFFNKTEQDILFNNILEDIAKEDDRFVVTNILSNAGPSWIGHTGRISKELLKNIFDKDSMKCYTKCTHYACICGPNEFTHTSLDLLKQEGMKDNCLHAFMG